MQRKYCGSHHSGRYSINGSERCISSGNKASKKNKNHCGYVNWPVPVHSDARCGAARDLHYMECQLSLIHSEFGGFPRFCNSAPDIYFHEIYNGSPHILPPDNEGTELLRFLRKIGEMLHMEMQVTVAGAVSTEHRCIK